jgi:L-lactate dehydrogenase complex protein LldG
MTSLATEAASLLLDEFIIEARNAVATVEVVDRNPQALSAAILAKAGDAQRILFAPPQVMPPELFAPFASDPRVISEPDSEQMVHSAVGVTEAFAGVGRTGSVCVDVNYQRSAVVSLLAPLHIAVLAAENIVPQLRDLFRPDILNGQGLTRDFVFITGPSATADMGPLVRGVHGPHRLHIIVVR